MPANEDSYGAHVCDTELLRQMAAGPRGGERETAAWQEFYDRHRQYLYAVCRRAYATTLGDGRLEELVQDTFVRAYEKAGTYKSDGQVDRILGRQRVRAWLGRISENIVHDYYRHEPQIIFMDERELPPEDPADPVEGTSDSEKLRRLADALEQLSEREQEVLRVTAMWYKPGERQQRLPNSEMKKLASSWNTSSDNIRQIRARALAKLKASMET